MPANSKKSKNAAPAKNSVSFEFECEDENVMAEGKYFRVHQLTVFSIRNAS